jgi:hypothetical protein
MVKSIPDYLTMEQALQLAAKIEKIWHEQGHFGVRAWAEKVSGESSRVRNSYAVRSNLVRGLPAP